MLTKIKTRFRRAPAFAISVVVLAAILSGVLCGLQAANRAEQRHYETLCESTPVKLVVTNLSGTRRTGLTLPSFVLRVFTKTTTENSLAPYIKGIEAKMDTYCQMASIGERYMGAVNVVGISNLQVSGDLLKGSKSMVTWLEGYDESVLAGKDEVCIVPESWIADDGDLSLPIQVSLNFSYTPGSFGASVTYDTAVTYTVVGIHSVSDTAVYCPFQQMQRIYSRLGKPAELDAIQGTLIDNSLQEEVRQVANAWFAEPNPTGTKTPWRYSYYFYYPFALDIDNDILVTAERTLKTSILTNQICAFLVFVLSAGASFFVGFLMIRSRRREIALMRTLGTSNLVIYGEFMLEQLTCVLAGVFLGGAIFLWRPVQRLGIFLAIYLAGLTLALLIFLHTNLLATMKEEE